MNSAFTLDASGVCVRYGKALAVQRAALSLAPGSIAALVGPNGAGKTSLLRAIVGVTPSEADFINFEGKSILPLSPTERVKAGLVLVPQGRMLFRHMSVRDNLLVIANSFDVGRSAVDQALERFPILKLRQHSFAGVLSGGEQQMLALARALMCDPRVLILDEPTLGLAPSVVKGVIDVLLEMREEGKSILIAEPTLRLLPKNLDRGFVIMRGQIVAEANSSEELERLYQERFGDRVTDSRSQDFVSPLPG